jgi:exodeoxyribonuclease VII large subunit
VTEDAPLPENPSADNQTGHNQPELSVGELSRSIKGLLEGSFERVRVRGEVLGAKRHSSGHFYFDLKDAAGGTAKIAGVCWKGQLRNLTVIPRDGDEVVVTGRVTTYADRSSYQLQAFDITYAGEGALLARIERLRQALTKEGLFDEQRKRPLPLLPRVLGVVTSPTGAVIQDILTTMRRRFPVHVILWPVPVQGEGAAPAIAAAIAGFNALRPGGAVPVPDVLIVGRGGGSLEDLMAFNEEAVVRAAAGSRIPLISAVGHETDTTLIDFASDRRAPTPTAAAELALPMRAELADRLTRLGLQLGGQLRTRAQAQRLRLERAGGRLPDLPRLVAERRQQLDDRAGRLGLALPAWVRARREILARLGSRLASPAARIAGARGAAALLAQRLEAAQARLLERRRAALGALAARLDSVSYEATLKRGFALVSDARGNPVTAAAKVAPAARLKLAFADGAVDVTADAPARQGRLL